MTWRMPAETSPHDRIWMAFPREGEVMGDSSAAREATYAAWAAVAESVAAPPRRLSRVAWRV